MRADSGRCRGTIRHIPQTSEQHRRAPSGALDSPFGRPGVRRRNAGFGVGGADPDDFYVESGHNGLADPRLTQELYAAIGVNPRFACVRVDASDEHFSEEQQMQLRVVRSDQKGVMQHLTFSWQVSGNDFEYLPQVSPSSQLFNRSLNGWLESLSTEDRERAVDALFSVLRSSHADSISDLMAAGLKAVPTMINTFVGLSEADRRHLIEAMGLLMAAVRSRSSR